MNPEYTNITLKDFRAYKGWENLLAISLFLLALFLYNQEQAILETYLGKLKTVPLGKMVSQQDHRVNIHYHWGQKGRDLTFVKEFIWAKCLFLASKTPGNE